MKSDSKELKTQRAVNVILPLLYHKTDTINSIRDDNYISLRARCNRNIVLSVIVG